MKNDFGLELQNLNVVYPNGKIALNNVSFKIPTGTITGLVGINGAGKSTVFKAIMGFVKLHSGSVKIFNKNIKNALKNNIVAYVPQSEDIDWNFPILVKDVVMMGRYGKMNFLRIPNHNDKEEVLAALKKVEMQDFVSRQIGELSGGQRKRVFLARSLAQKAKIILLDEPFSGVDAKTEEAIFELLCELRSEGKIILIATHNLGSVPRYCDRTILVKQSIIANGPTKKIFTRQNLELAFGGVLRHFVLEGDDLHQDEDKRSIRVISDDERPFIMYTDEEKEKSD